MIRLHIPATSANLGPGFDCLGLALDLWNTFDLRLAGEPGEISVTSEGEGSKGLPQGRQNLVARTLMDETWPGIMPSDAGIQIHCHNRIPVASGMGSSSTAVLAGLVFASALAARALHLGEPEKVLAEVQSPANLDRVLSRAIKLEGHGDNVGPALKGGLVLVVNREYDPVVRNIDFADLKAVVCVPDYNFLTSEARAMLPGEVTRTDAIHNIGHSMLVVEALRTGDKKLLAQAISDRIHEPTRMALIPGAHEAKRGALAEGAHAVALSGAGPGLIAFADDDHLGIGMAMVHGFAQSGIKARYWTLDAVRQGLRIEPLAG